MESKFSKKLLAKPRLFPKQLPRWIKKAKLKPESTYKRYRLSETAYLIGQDRRWRINDRLAFQCSCPLAHFDRWANSVGAQTDRLPATEAEFLATVALLIEQSKSAR